MGLAGYGDHQRFSSIDLYEYDGDDVRLHPKILEHIDFPDI